MAHNFTLPPNLAAAQQVSLTPMNDVQVTAIIAAAILPHLASVGATAEAVDLAIELFAHSILRAKNGRLMERVRELEVLHAVVADARQ